MFSESPSQRGAYLDLSVEAVEGRAAQRAERRDAERRERRARLLFLVAVPAAVVAIAQGSSALAERVANAPRDRAPCAYSDDPG